MGDDPAGTDIASVRPDGSGRRVHFTLPDADEAAVSPDGAWLAFQEGDNIYRMSFPYGGTGFNTVRIAKRNGQLPVTQVSIEGGIHPRWRDAATLEFVSGPRYYAHDVTTGDTDEVPLELELPRHIASGTVAFTGTRLITVENDVVLENGTLVSTDGRLSCIGECDPAGADRVIDASGKTIMPGLIDMHAHHHRDHLGIIPLRNWESAIYLAYGVTTTLDNSQWSANVFPAAELVESGRMIGPRVYSTGDPVYSGDGARQNEITSYELADQNVARLMSWGAVSIKEYMQPRRDQDRGRNHPRRPLPGAGTRTRLPRRGEARRLRRPELQPARRHPRHKRHRLGDQGRHRVRRRHPGRAVAGRQAIRRALLGGRGRADQR